MAKVTYKPEPGTPDRHVQFGVEFGPEPVEVTEHQVLAKVRGNPFYEVVDEAQSEQSGLTARHRGGGTYGVFDGAQLLDGVAPMKKEDADAFNALSEAEKAAFVEAPPSTTT